MCVLDPRESKIRRPESTNVNLHCRLDLAGGLHARRKENDVFTYYVLKFMLEEDLDRRGGPLAGSGAAWAVRACCTERAGAVAET